MKKIEPPSPISRTRSRMIFNPIFSNGGFAALLLSSSVVAEETYVMRPHESLSGILHEMITELRAKKSDFRIYGRSGLLQEIFRLNPQLTDLNHVAAGTVIKLPKKICSLRAKGSDSSGPPSENASEPIRLVAAATAVDPQSVPLYWRAGVTFSGERLDLEEKVNGAVTRTTGQNGFPRIGTEVALSVEPYPTRPHWEFGINGSFSQQAPLIGVIFPNNWSAGLFVTKQGAVISQGLRMNLRFSGLYESLSQATPNDSASNFSVRNTTVMWGTVGTCLATGGNGFGRSLCVDLSRSLSLQSSAATGASAMAALAGWRESLALETDLAMQGRLSGVVDCKAVQLFSAKSEDYLHEVGAGLSFKYKFGSWN